MRSFVTLWLLLVSWNVFAQTNSDLIYKLDQTNFKAVVDEIGEREIMYFLPADLSKRSLLRIERRQVWKVVYGNGETEIINAPAAQPEVTTGPARTGNDRIFLRNKTMLTGQVVKVTDQTMEYRKEQSGPLYELSRKDLARIEYSNGNIEEFASQTSEAASSMQGEQTAPQVTIEKKRNAFTDKFSATIGPEAGYFLGPKFWTHKEDGLGFLTSLGGSLRVDYKLNKPVSLYFSTGYNRASVERNYLQGDIATYQETYSLSIPHAGLGAKYSLTETVYALAEVRANFAKLKFSITEDGEKYEDALSAVCPSLSVGIGFRRTISRVIIDADIHYKFTKSAFEEVSDPIHVVGARLGIGLTNLFDKRAHQSK